IRHDRKVAVKVLRPELAAVIGAERFLAEIKTTANLQHPHILALFDSGEADSYLFYVMPYIEGISLRDRMRREKQLPITEAVRIGTEVASALDYAHRHGVIHRDIKPENILLHDGSALVADFGIALAASKAGTRLTETGMSLGTPQYMSPEQAMGERELDARSDVYALGCVTYEMLTGEPPFSGPTAQAIVAKVMTAEPVDMTSLRKTIPAAVADAVHTALQKLPADRFASAAEFATALRDPQFATTSKHRTARTATNLHATGSRREVYALAALSVVLLAAAAAGWLRPHLSAPTSRGRVVLWQHSLGEFSDPGGSQLATQAAIAPDGSSIVYTDSSGGSFHLMRKLRSASVATPLSGTDGALSPFFSPDGRWIGYSTVDGKLRKIPIDGGGSITLAARLDNTYTAGAWLDDGTIIYAGDGGLSRVNSVGGTSSLVTNTTSRERITVPSIWPLPGSRGVLYTRCPDNCGIGSEVRLFDLKTGNDQVLIPNAAGAWYSPTGHLLYTDRSGGLYAEGFDLARLKATSGPVPIIDDVIPNTFTLSASGTALYSTTAGGSVPAELTMVARDGSAVPLDSMWRGDFQYPALSPDGRSIAVSARDKTTQIWIRRADGTRQQLTRDGTVNWRPSWSADGQSVIFASNQRGGSPDDFDVYQMSVDGGTSARQLLHYRFPVWEAELSPDGRWLVARFDEELNVGRIRARRLDGDTALIPLVVEKVGARQIALSPDGHWIAYSENSSGRWEIYVAPFPAATSPRLVSRDGGTEPRWAHTGRELFFKSAGQLMSVAVDPGATLTIGSPHALFSVAGYRSARNRPEYAVAPDDQHFLMIRDLSGRSVDLVYVENWFPELLARVKR
ncbi:MAG: protein kinase domain-containing protein, partial [Gemmatimonadales bacterium]